MSEQYSLVRAISETLQGGIPTGKVEREFHFTAERAFSEVRPIAALRTSSGGTFRSFFAPLSILLTRDLSVSGEGSALVGLKTYGRSDLASWSSVIRAGALVAAGLKDRASFYQVSTLPTPTWQTETGMDVPTDCSFTGFLVQPKRLAAVEIVSRQLLIQSPGLEEMLRADLSRQLGSLVDQVCLLGTGPANNQPTGISATAGVHQIAFSGGAPSYANFAHAERLCGEANVSMDFYAVICSPAGKEVLQTTEVVAGYPIFIWDKLTNPLSSMEVSDNRGYMGCYQMLTIAIWSGLEILLDPYSQMPANQIRLIANLWVDVAVRLPSAFAMSDAITPIP